MQFTWCNWIPNFSNLTKWRKRKILLKQTKILHMLNRLGVDGAVLHKVMKVNIRSRAFMNSLGFSVRHKLVMITSSYVYHLYFFPLSSTWCLMVGTSCTEIERQVVKGLVCSAFGCHCPSAQLFYRALYFIRFQQTPCNRNVLQIGPTQFLLTSLKYILWP